MGIYGGDLCLLWKEIWDSVHANPRNIQERCCHVQKCQAEYKNPFVETVKAWNAEETVSKVEQIKQTTGNYSPEFDALLREILHEVEASSMEERAKQQNLEKEQESIRSEILRIQSIPVTTADLKCKYMIVSPVIFSVRDNEAAQVVFKNLSLKYEAFPYNLMMTVPCAADRSFSSNIDVVKNQREYLFYISLSELKLRAASMGADAIIGMRVNFDAAKDLTTDCYFQMYGTAVKLLEE